MILQDNNYKQIINLLSSEDKDTRKLGVNIIKRNYITNFKINSINNKLYIKASNNIVDISDVLFYATRIPCNNSFLEKMLNLIIEYNEEQRRINKITII